MEIFPAIDLMSGEAVRLTKGEFSSKKVYSSDPVEVMLSFKAEGARHLHVVDLDGARTGGNQNFDVVKDLCAAGAPDIEIGGGIRDMRRAEKYLSLGVKRIILGTAAVEDEAFLNEAVGEWGDKVAVGVDVLNGFVRTRGWESVSRLDGFAFVNRMVGAGVKRIIYTDISRDGLLTGPDAATYEKLARTRGAEIVASGGVSSLTDLKALRFCGVYGAIVGKAVYEKRFTVSEAVRLGDGYDS